ncbi:aldo/keto reductase [Tabrizicola sp.]|uniref:aldo/keto reductase n=1 Tax=Tabrizicola sp. TaxID=2005166 RepID=UPI003F34CA3A
MTATSNLSQSASPNGDATFALGGDLAVNRVGLGAMRLTGQPGNFGPYAAWDEGKRLLSRAVELGINFIDTARAYGPQWNEKLIAEALHPYPDDLVIATKGGIDKLSPTDLVRDGSAAALAKQIDEALINLRRETIDLFQLHWVDPNTPIEVSVRAMDDARRTGKLRHIGLCNVSIEELNRAMAVAPIASVQNRYNILEREHDAMVDLTAAAGIAFIPYGPLGAHPMRAGAPLSEGVSAGVMSPAQTALRQLLDRSPNIIVIPGTTSIKHLEENAGAGGGKM